MSSSISVLVITLEPSRFVKIEKLLANTDVTLFKATDSQQALTILKDVELDVIVSDDDIDQLDGWRLARMIRANLFKCSSDTPFILIADTHCEHLADTTASAFDIDKVLPQNQLDHLANTVLNALHNRETSRGMLSLLIVEDEPDIAELIQRILSKQYQIQLATDGQQAVDMYQKGLFDIVLLDVQLPEISGAQVLEQIIAVDPKQAVVIMTAHGDTDLAGNLMSQGAVDFISKPFRAEQLRKVISIAAHRENFLISNAQFAEKVQTIESSKEKFRQLYETHNRLLEHLSTVIMELDPNGRILFANQAWTELTGYSEAESQGKCLTNFIEGSRSQNATLLTDNIDLVMRQQTATQGIEFQIKHKQGQLIWVEAILDDINLNDRVVGVTATIDNINERKQAQLELNYLASHDTLTGLFNRHYFDEKLIELANSALDHKHVHSLLYLDLDRFKIINDTQGHHQGDVVLKEVAASLNGIKRDDDIICRIGGDEFALLLPHTPKETSVRIAQNVCDILHQGHYQFGEAVFQISGSVGLSEINGSATQPETYLQQADIALYVAKKRGRNLVHVYTPDDRESGDFQASVNWVRTLQEAIFDDQLVLHFQPVIDSSSNQIAYYEALVRLQIDGKLVMPGEFIPALERAEDMTLLDHQVISKAIFMISQNSILTKVAINLSAQAFGDERLMPIIQQKLEQYQVNPEQIIFEVTESASMSNLNATQKMINQLMELGCEFSIDDFGTGFSTFSYLKDLPANCVKIDGSFVKDMLTNSIDLAIVKAICDIAKSLNKTTVAEFVEDEETLLKLRQLGVDYLQGYHISRPMPVTELASR